MSAIALIAPDAASLAAAVAARTITSLVDAIAERGAAHLCVTGGTIGTASLAAIAQSPAVSAVAWERVHVWWSDERFCPVGDPDRNDTAARTQFLDLVAVDPAHVHSMPAPGGAWGDDPELAADAYAAELAAAAAPGQSCPEFDVLMLGVGPDGHVASLFPGRPELTQTRPVCGVVGSPKPPPVRLTFSFATIGRARQVWLVASGAEKAEAMANALGFATVPAGMVSGTETTLALLDRSAAALLPGG